MARIGFLSHADMSLYFFRALIMRELKKRGHEVFAIAPKGDYSEILAREFNSITYELDKASVNPLKVLKNSHNLARNLADLRLDMLQTSAHKSNVFGTFAAKKAGIPVVINLVEGLGSFYIDADLKSKIIKFMLEKLYKKAFKLSNGCIFVNDSNPDYMFSRGLISKEKIFRIKSVGVDLIKFDESKYQKLDFGGKKVVLMMGRALWHKGIREFYKAAEILKERKDCVFVFVGDIFKGNRSSADENFLKNKTVKWLGWRNDVCELYKSADIFVLPSYKEGFPRTVLEAMAMKIPCIVSDCEGSVEAVKDGETGLICKMKNAKDLADKITRLLDDENLAKNLAKNAYERVVKEFDERIIAKKYIEVYGKFIDV